MEQLKAKLFRLLKEELDNLALGHSYDKGRLQEMRQICRLLAYWQYVDGQDIVKLVQAYGD